LSNSRSAAVRRPVGHVPGQRTGTRPTIGCPILQRKGVSLMQLTHAFHSK